MIKHKYIVLLGLVVGCGTIFGMAQRSARALAPAASNAARRAAMMRRPIVPAVSLGSAAQYSTTRSTQFRSTAPQMMTRQEAFAILGLKAGASAQEIKAAFYQAAKQAHPDVGGTTKQMQELNQAYDLLQDKRSQEFDFDQSTQKSWDENRRRAQEEKRRKEKEFKIKPLLFRRIKEGDVWGVESFIRDNPDFFRYRVDIFDGSFNQTPLSYAIAQLLDHSGLKYISKESSEIRIIKLLLDAGAANLNEENPFAQIVANLSNFKDISTAFYLLLAAGANPNIMDNHGLSALLYAAYNVNYELIKMLLDAGADPNIVSYNQGSENANFADSFVIRATPLSLAIGIGENRSKCVELLLQGGALPNTMIGYKGKKCLISVFHLLVKVSVIDQTNPTMIADLKNQLQALLKAGGDINSKDGDGKTAYDYACEAKVESVAQIFRSAGAKSAEELSQDGNDFERPLEKESSWFSWMWGSGTK